LGSGTALTTIAFLPVAEDGLDDTFSDGHSKFPWMQPFSGLRQPSVYTSGGISSKLVEYIQLRKAFVEVGAAIVVHLLGLVATQFMVGLDEIKQVDR
jgi:hypothetical protein